MEKQELEKLAALARITVSSDDLAKLHKDMEGILKYVSQIQEAHTDVTYTKVLDRDAKNVMRADESPHETGAYSKELLAEAPKTEHGYVKVKKIL